MRFDRSVRLIPREVRIGSKPVKDSQILHRPFNFYVAFTCSFSNHDRKLMRQLLSIGGTDFWAVMSYQQTLDQPELSIGEPQGLLLDPVNHPVIAAVNVIAAELLEILGPMLWAALVVLCLVAEFSSN